MHLLAHAGGFEHFNFLRKPASDWGWDWGPAFAPSGIHGDVQLLALDYALIQGDNRQVTNQSLSGFC
jgi:hypothetical protein